MDNPTRSPIRPVQNMIVIAFVIALAAVATTGILAWTKYQDFTESLTEVENPKKYLKELNGLISQLLEAEGSLRSYALTGDKDDLKAQRIAMEKYTERIADLKRLRKGMNLCSERRTASKLILPKSTRSLRNWPRSPISLLGKLSGAHFSPLLIPHNIQSLMRAEVREDETQIYWNRNKSSYWR